MAPCRQTDQADPPQYTRYRVGPRLLRRARPRGEPLPPPSSRAERWARAAAARADASNACCSACSRLALAWVALSLVLFLVSSHFERTPLPADVAGVLDPSGYPLTSANNILVLGSDRRQKNSREPGAKRRASGARTRSC